METNIEEEGYKGYSVISGLPSKMRDKSREEISSGLLEDVATWFILFTHSCVEKMAALPFPVGTIIEAVEELVYPFVHPIEGFTLRFLAAVDDQIYGVGTTVEGYVLCLRSRGLVGMSADLWVHFEAAVRERMQTVIGVANKIPLVGRMITPLVCAISTPLGNAVSQWLVEHSQSKVKRIQFPAEITEREEKGKEGLDEPKEVEAAGRDMQDQALTAAVIEEEGAIKDRQGPEISSTPTDILMSKTAPAAEAELKGVPEHKAGVKLMPHVDDKDVSAVLELIDSGWLLGSTGPASPKMAALPTMPAVAAPPKASAASAAAVLPRTPAATATAKPAANPIKKAANPKSRRKH